MTTGFNEKTSDIAWLGILLLMIVGIAFWGIIGYSLWRLFEYLAC